MRTPRTKAPSRNDLLKQYECGAVNFSGDPNASYERHLLFDHVVEPQAANLRERFEAVASALRDLLAQRWVKTHDTYDRANPKQVYYLSMEFLIGRSLTNNLTNLLVEPMVREVLEREGLDLIQLARAGARCRSGQRWAGASGGLLYRFTRHAAVPGDRLWPAL
jgi:glycogen phosphorylase